jgi:putative transposase
MSISIRFKAGETWLFRGRRMRFECEMGNGRLFFRDEDTLSAFQVEDEDGSPCAPSTDWAIEAYARGDLKRERDFSGLPQRRQAALQDIDLEAAQQKDPQSILRLRVLTALDRLPELPRSDRAVGLAISRLWGADPDLAARFPRKPSPKSVRRWLDERGAPGERHLSLMVSRAGRVKRKKRLPSDIHAVMHEAALWYWSSRRWSIGNAYARCMAAIIQSNGKRKLEGLAPLTEPSDEWFRQVVRGLECYETVREKYGARAANMRFKPCGKGTEATRILQIGVMDHTVLDGVAVIDADYMPARWSAISHRSR